MRVSKVEILLLRSLKVKSKGYRLEPVSLAFEASKPGVRPKSKTDSQREPVLLCSLTPARLIRIKRITSDEA